MPSVVGLLEQARSAGKFTSVHDAWWAAAVKAHCDAEGIRALIEVLLLGWHIAHEYVHSQSPLTARHPRSTTTAHPISRPGAACVHSPRHLNRPPATHQRIPLAPTPSGDDRNAQRLTNNPLNVLVEP